MGLRVAEQRKASNDCHTQIQVCHTDFLHQWCLGLAQQRLQRECGSRKGERPFFEFRGSAYSGQRRCKFLTGDIGDHIREYKWFLRGILGVKAMAHLSIGFLVRHLAGNP